MSIPEKLWSAGDSPRDPVAAPTAEAPPPRPPRPSPSQRPAPRARMAPVVAALLVVAVLVAGIGTLLVTGSDDDRPAAAGALPSTTEPLPGLKESGNSVGQIYAAASPAVVSIRSSAGEGTGFVVKSDGTIVTNEHVVGSDQSVQVRLGDDGRTVDARVLGADTSSDLAVLKVSASDVSGITPLALADSDRVKVGDDVVAIGNPFGLDRTATSGIVSAIGRQIEAPDGFSIDEVIQTDGRSTPATRAARCSTPRARSSGSTRRSRPPAPAAGTSASASRCPPTPCARSSRRSSTARRSSVPTSACRPPTPARG
jgi:Trypsin-like peptidase domain